MPFRDIRDFLVAEKYRADGYAKTAGTAVDEAIRLLQMLKKEELG